VAGRGGDAFDRSRSAAEGDGLHRTTWRTQPDRGGEEAQNEQDLPKGQKNFDGLRLSDYKIHRKKRADYPGGHA